MFEQQLIKYPLYTILDDSIQLYIQSLIDGKSVYPAKDFGFQIPWSPY